MGEVCGAWGEENDAVVVVGGFGRGPVGGGPTLADVLEGAGFCAAFFGAGKPNALVCGGGGSTGFVFGGGSTVFGGGSTGFTFGKPAAVVGGAVLGSSGEAFCRGTSGGPVGGGPPSLLVPVGTGGTGIVGGVVIGGAGTDMVGGPCSSADLCACAALGAVDAVESLGGNGSG